MNDSSNPLLPALGRGAKLGLVWTAVFFGAAALIYLIMGLVGWDGVARALCALLVAPVFAISAIAAWWMIRRPDLAAAGEQESAARFYDPARTMVSHPTRPLNPPPTKEESDDPA